MQKERETTLVLVTHDETLAAQCDSWYRLEAGKLVAEKVLSPEQTDADAISANAKVNAA